MVLQLPWGGSSLDTYWSEVGITAQYLTFTMDFCLSGRITEWFTLKGNSEVPVIQAPCSSRISQTRLPSTMPWWFLNLLKDRYYTTTLGNLCQCFITHNIKKCFCGNMCWCGNPCAPICAHCLLSCPWASLKKAGLECF